MAPEVPRPTDGSADVPDGAEYDVVVLGAGSTGENVAARAAGGGLSVVVVEAELVGGDCSYWACMPSKALLRPAEALREARTVAGAREAVTGPLDAAAVLARRDSFVHDYDDSSQVDWLDGRSLPLVRGLARFTGPREVRVERNGGGVLTLRARHAVAVCVGSEPALPPVEGLAEADPWRSRDATSAKNAPRRLAVLGGGVVGCEMATAWRALGSEEVTVLQHGERLLPGYEPEVGRRLAEELRGQGVDVRTGTEVTAVHRREDGTVTVTTDDGGTLEADELLVATGRAPRTRDLGLETIGLEPGTWLQVDDSMRVTGVAGGWLYAAGDVNSRALLTHMGKYQARVCGDVIAARARGDADADSPAAWSRYTATADHRAVPQVVFTDPPAASVGLTEAAAREAGLRVRSVDYELGNVSGAAVHTDGYSGWARFVVDEDRRVLVGVTFLGPGIEELLHSATVAVVGEVPLDRLWHAVPAYPTISEAWLRFLEQYGM